MRRIRKFMIVVAILVIISLAGLASAATVDGEAIGESHEYIEEGPDYAIAEKYVYHELYDGAKISDSACGSVHAESDDGTVVLDIDDAKIKVYGEVKGDGMAILYGSLYAAGFRDDINGTYNATAEVSSSVDLNSGDKGKATGKVSAEGFAEATVSNIEPDGAGVSGVVENTVGEPSPKPGAMVLKAEACGTTFASGTVQSTSGNNGELRAEGEVFAFVEKDPEAGLIWASVNSYVNGEDRSEGTASASGEAYAAMTYGKKGTTESGSIVQLVGKEEPGLFTRSTGSTEVRGSAKGDGIFEGEADIISEITYSHDPMVVYRFTSEIASGAYMVGENTYKGSASASAMAPFDYSQPGNQWPVEAWSAMGDCRNAEINAQANMVDAKVYQQGEGMTAAESLVTGQVRYPGYLEGPFAASEVGLEEDENLEACIGVVILSADNGFADGSFIGSGAFAEGESSRYSGSARTSALGAVDARADGYGGLNPPGHSDTIAGGHTTAAASAGGTGEASAAAAIQSTNHVYADGIAILIEADIPLYEDASIVLPDVELPDLPDELCYLLGGMNMQTGGLESMTQFDAGMPDEIPLPDEIGPMTIAIFIETPLPLVETSLISSESSATGCASKDTASASATADGITAAWGGIPGDFDSGDLVGQFSDGEPYPWEAETWAEGEVATSASANKASDPASAALIFAASVQGADVDNGIDIALIGSASFADGVKGRTSGMAGGSANATGNFVPFPVGDENFDTGGPVEAEGIVNTYASADGGTGISVAGIAAADYVSYEYPPVDLSPDVEIVDVALLGSGSAALGKATARAGADGNAAAWHEFNYSLGHEQGFTVLEADSAVGVTGSAVTSARTSNGIALAIDGIAAAQYLWSESEYATSYAEGQINSGGLIGEVVFAQRPGGRGYAESQAAAQGVASTSGSFYGLIGQEGGELMYVESSADTKTYGQVIGMADVSCGDPLSASLIMTYADTNGFGYDTGSAYGDAYGAGLMLAASVASGPCASTDAYAAGGTLADTTFTFNGTAFGYPLLEADTFSTLSSGVETEASSRSFDTLAIGLALDGVSSASDFYMEVDGMNGVGLGPGPWPSFFDISTFGAVSAVTGQGKASAATGVDEARAQSSVTVTEEVEDDEDGEFNITAVAASETTAEGVAVTEVNARGGYGISAAGEISGIFTEYDADDDRYAGITSFSAIADLAVAESFGTKERATARALASGSTMANGSLVDEGLLMVQYTNATGRVTAESIANKYSDPLAGSVIIGFGMDIFNPEEEGLEEEVFETYDATLIASAVLTGGDKGEAEATASGEANATGGQLNFELDPTRQNGDLFLMSSMGNTTADTFSSASATDGYSLGVSAAGSSSMAAIIDDEPEVRDMNILVSYAAGEGFGKKAWVAAEAGYDGASYGFSTLLSPDVGGLASVSGVEGEGSSTIKAYNCDLAKALTFAVAYQEVNEDDLNAYSAFGTQVAATDDAKRTMAAGRMEDVSLLAAAANGSALSMVQTSGGVSFITLDPDRNPKVTWDTYATYVHTDGVYELSGDQKFYQTYCDPNYAYWYKYAAASEDPIPVPPEGFLFILPGLPPVTV